ncbi:MAG: O-antigen ligase family protein [Bacteroidetes bacterium]|nr:O-antigen ligase family protein [Bacteroidota bacterium]
MTTSVKNEVNSVYGYVAAFLAGMIVGYRSIPELFGLIYVGLGVACIYLATRQDLTRLFKILPFLIYSEMFMRAYVSFIPYLFMPYLYIAIFGIMILSNGVKLKLHSNYVVFLLFFVFIEYINGFRSNDADYARGLLINTTALAVVALWGATTVITPLMANRILNTVKLAGIYLCGMVIIRYFKGEVYFSSYSQSEGVNGLAPVQLSGYMGFVVTVFFFTIMNGFEKKNLLLNLICISMATIIMLLSFSRGGIYFFGIMIILYSFFNRKQLHKYLFFILLIPTGLFVYNFVTAKTNGLIEERYKEEGNSGRTYLVEAAWDLFLSHPLAGVGPGNFNTEITKDKLYDQESGAHNEFARAAAEDGILGVITYWGFFLFLFLDIMKRKPIQREYAFYFAVFFCLVIVHNGLKISLQPLLILLAVATPTIRASKNLHVTFSKKPTLQS